MTLDKAEAVLEAFCAIQCKWRLWYEPQVSIEKWYLEILAKNKERSGGREVQPIQGGLSMSVHAFPSGTTAVRAWQLHPLGSCVQCGQQHVFYYSSAYTQEAEPQEAEEMFVTIGWLVLSWEPNSQLVWSAVAISSVYTYKIDIFWVENLTFNLHLCSLCIASK